MGEVRIRAGRARRYVLALCGAVAGGVALAALSIAAFPLLEGASPGMLLPGGAPALPIIFAIALLAMAIAANALFAQRLTPAFLDPREAATRRLALRGAPHGRLQSQALQILSEKPARILPPSAWPHAARAGDGRRSSLAPSSPPFAITKRCRRSSLPERSSRPWASCCFPVRSRAKSAAFGLLGGEIGARIMGGAASWIMLAVSGFDAQRSLARVFLAEYPRPNRFMRDHLPVPCAGSVRAADRCPRLSWHSRPPLWSLSPPRSWERPSKAPSPCSSVTPHSS